jgi:hypothetical protein
MGTEWRKQERKYVSLYSILKLWQKILHIRDYWRMCYVMLVGGGGNMSIKPERRFGRNLMESTWQNKHDVGVTSISQIIKSRCNAIQRHLSLVGRKENGFYFHNEKWRRRRKG